MLKDMPQPVARSHTGVRRGVWAVCAAAAVLAVTMLGTTLPTPLYGLYERQFRFGSFIVTVVYAVYAIGVIAALLLFGQWSDQIGRRPLLLAAVVLSALSAVTFLIADGLPLLFVGRVLSGLSAGLVTGTATAAIVELAPPKHRRHAPLVATAVNIGGLGCGPLLAGILAQYVPEPLRTPFAVDLALLAAAGLLVLLLPETVRASGQVRLRQQRLRVPREVRRTFVSATIAGFAGFATLGLFTSVSPSFLTQVLGIRNAALSGLVVFVVFAASAAGQLATGRVQADRALPLGCAILTLGMILIAGSLLSTSLGLLIVGAVVTGAGQGMGFRAAIAAVSEQSPPERRGEITSALFVALYIGISIPVVGVGACAQVLGLRTAGVAFAAIVALLALLAAIRVVRPAEAPTP
jgi:MFS family permease